MNIVEKVKSYVESECRKPSSKYGFDPFEFHFIPMVAHAENLAKLLGADREIVLLAAWLHDIGSIIEGRKDHHISGARIAEAKLLELNYPPARIELIKKCILHHRGSTKSECQTLEEKIISEADAISNFDNIAGCFKAAFVYEGLTQGEARESVRKKLQNKYNQLYFAESKRIIKPKYEAAMLLLS